MPSGAARPDDHENRRRFALGASVTQTRATAIELFQSPPMDIRTEGDNTKTVLFAPRGFNDMTSAERVRAAFQHAILQNLSGARLTNLSLRKRLGIADQNMAQASRIIKQAMNDGLIRSADPESPRAGYVPYWAT